MFHLHDNAPCFGYLVRVAWSNIDYTRNRPQRGKLLHRLMGRTIFSNANRVVSKNVNHRNFHDRCETQRTSSIVAKDQKTGAKSSELSQCQSVQDRSHRMLANTEMNISPSKGIATNITGIRKGESRLGRRRRSAEPPTNHG